MMMMVLVAMVKARVELVAAESTAIVLRSFPSNALLAPGEQLMAMPKLMAAQYGINAVNKKIGISEQQVKARIRLAEKRAKETKEKKGWLLKKLDKAAASKPRANATRAY